MPWQARLQQAWLGRGPLAVALLPLALLFASVTTLHRWGYRSGALRRERLPVPVLVVGNVVAGGAGKTPAVLAVLRHLQERGWSAGVVSRGHGGSERGPLVLSDDTTPAQAGDEPVLLRRRAAVPVAIGRDRVGAARALLGAHPELDILVSDDGLQHARMARDVEILVFDHRGAGNGWPLPAGPLREPATRHAELVLFNAPAPSLDRPGYTSRRRLHSLVPLADWSRNPGAAGHDWSALRGLRVLAAAGIAQPEPFFDMLREQGLEFATLALPDHHRYDALPWNTAAHDAVLVTEKDAVKLCPRWGDDPRLWVVTLDFEPESGFFEALDRALPNAPHT